jgi:hypothetical protein
MKTLLNLIQFAIVSVVLTVLFYHCVNFVIARYSSCTLVYEYAETTFITAVLTMMFMLSALTVKHIFFNEE